MGKSADITGEKFGRLVAIRPAGKNKYKNCLWECVCECGRVSVVTVARLRSGKTKSCGCLAQEASAALAERSKRANKYRVVGDYAIGTDVSGNEFIVDTEDLPELKRNYWAKDGRYFTHSENGKKFYLHRTIINAPDGCLVDHINRDKADNRKSNLRLCTKTENNWNRGVSGRNSSGCTGVTKHSSGKYWEAFIQYKGRRLRRIFKDKESAVQKRREWELALYDEFAPV